MKKISLLKFSLWIAVLMACQLINESTEISMLKPGDEIGSMVITTGVAQAPPLWAFCAPASENEGIKSMDCQVPRLSKLAIGHTFGLVDPALQALDWSELSWELSVDGQSVDLEAFGTYDFVLPDLAARPSPIREIFRQIKAWNVVLLNPTPGAHVLYGAAHTEANTYRWFVNFHVETSVAK